MIRETICVEVYHKDIKSNQTVAEKKSEAVTSGISVHDVIRVAGCQTSPSLYHALTLFRRLYGRVKPVIPILKKAEPD